ncbi:hypothetical protein [Streptomyces rubrogriseus]|uniref:hypothetical protein n=1 Tax=Streptomyces rubrogriseus TaxID=194673 RepID=UPI003687CAEF
MYGFVWLVVRESSNPRTFARGHDKVAEAALLAADYGSSVPQLLHKHGHGPGHSVTAKAVHEGSWEKCPNCAYVGAPASIRLHQKKADH